MTSSTSNNSKHLQIYALMVVLCGLFSSVYQYFSHQVYSDYMVYAFTIPLLLGVTPHAIFAAYPRWNKGCYWQKMTQAFAIAVLTVGSIVQGMLEIYGTTSPFTIYYLVIGSLLLTFSCVSFIRDYKKQKRRPRRH